MSKHRKVIDELQHQYLNKQDNYPDNPEDAMTMLSYHQDTTHKKKFHKESRPTRKSSTKNRELDRRRRERCKAVTISRGRQR
jgi:hypothetical protein